MHVPGPGLSLRRDQRLQVAGRRRHEPGEDLDGGASHRAAPDLVPVPSAGAVSVCTRPAVARVGDAVRCFDRVHRGGETRGLGRRHDGSRRGRDFAPIRPFGPSADDQGADCEERGHGKRRASTPEGAGLRRARHLDAVESGAGRADVAPGDADGGPNGRLNFPVLTEGGPTEVKGTACAGCRDQP